MATTPILTGAGNLSDFANTVAAQAQAILNGGNQADIADLWPIQCMGSADRLELAGIQGIETSFHLPFEQGRFTERPVGDAMASLMIKKNDLDEKIQTYLNMNKLALDGQLPDTPRAIKYAADSVIFVQQIRTFVQTQIALVSALEANVQALLASQAQMLHMITANQAALANLLNEICNWGLPSLPSLAAQFGNLWHWNGFNFNSISGFKFNPLLGFNFNFSFAQCTKRTPNLAAAFASTPANITDGALTIGAGTLPTPIANGTYGTPAQFTDPSYIATMQATTTPVFDPSLVTASNGTSLPTPASIISDYALPAATYQANIVSAVPALGPVIIQPGDPDYNQAAPSASRLSTLRALSIRFLTLGQIVASNYDPNLTAAWLQYLGLNRTGRGGNWLTNMQAAYTEYVTPSLTYLSTTPVPWNAVLGGTGVSAAPAAIPLLAVVQATGGENILWKLSYIEAALLGYARNTTWDAAADTTFLSGFTGADLDYVPTTVNATPTASTILGEDTASFPVASTYPQSIAGTLAQVLPIAAANILATPSYQSTRPQFRFTFDMFAVASLVDRFSQFWREFNANLIALLTQDPYLVAFVVTYVLALDSAVDPLANPSIYTAIEADAASRNRAWLPGSILLPIPTATVLATAPTAPTDLSNGWAGGSFDAAAYLSRPDVQAQSIPAQIAMLRTNQSYAALTTLGSNLQTAVQAAVTNANISVSSVSVAGWEVETQVDIAVPPSGLVLPFGQVDFDQTGYVTDVSTITAQSTNPFILNVVLNWDPSGTLGTRTVSVAVNGDQVAVASVDETNDTPYTVQVSAILSLNEGDTVQVQASHSLPDPQTLLAGSTFLGLLDTNFIQQVTPPPAPPQPPAGSITLLSGVTFTAYTAVAEAADGTVYPVDPTTPVTGTVPIVDGIALQASTEAGASIQIAASYGTVFTTTGVAWTAGGLLYVAADGTLTQTFPTTNWAICVGKAVTPTTFIYQPHIPIAANGTVNAPVLAASHITGTGPAPTILLGLAAVVGTGASVSLQTGSNAVAGQIIFQSGSGTLFVGAALVLTIRSAVAAPNRQILTITSGNLATQQAASNAGASDSIDAQLDTMVGLQPNTQYIWNYHLLQI